MVKIFYHVDKRVIYRFDVHKIVHISCLFPSDL